MRVVMHLLRSAWQAIRHLRTGSAQHRFGIFPPSPPRPPTKVYFSRRQSQETSPWGSPSTRQWLFIGVTFAGGVVYYVVHIDRAPLTQRRRMIDISADQEAAIGKANFQMVLTQYHGRILPATSATSRYVERIGKRIAASAEAISPPGVHYQWEFVVIDAPEPNAFCLPGGKVAVFTGILPILVDENSVAAVLAHEIAHAVARHGAEKLAFAKILLLLQIVINQFIDTRLLTNLLMQLLLTLPFSRRMESEADYIGLHLMAAACFDPQAMAPMFERMKALREKLMRGHRSPPSYLSTHPADEDRVAAIIRWLPEVLPEYEAKCLPSGREWRRTLRSLSPF